MIVVRYADDLVAGFQHQADAERFLRGVSGAAGEVRAGDSSGEDAADRVRAIRSLAEPETARRGETGNVHVSGVHALLWRELERPLCRFGGETAAKRMRAKLQRHQAGVTRRMHEPVADVGKWLKRVVTATTVITPCREI